MPEIEKVIVHYSEKRTGGYQSVDFGLSLEVSLSEGESPLPVIEKYRDILRDQVTHFTEDEIERLIEEARASGRR